MILKCKLLVLSVLIKIFLSTSFASSDYSTINWCDIQNKLCKPENPHIGCNPDHVKPGNCTNIVKIEMTDELKNLFLNEHNKFRNQVASGKVPRLPSAVAMPKLEWDNELAYLAGIHVNQCNFEHDECRSTLKYKKSGQNIGEYSNDHRNYNTKTILMQGIQKWIEEHLTMDPEIIKRFTKKLNKGNGHALVIITDRVIAMGCACIRYEEYDHEDKEIHYKMLWTCNYSDTNMKGEPVYRDGPPGSECQKKCKDFSDLCSVN